MTKEEKQKALAAALGQIEKQFGKGSIMKLGDTKTLDVESISTGSLGLDVALGIGGLPMGRIVEIFGPESSGKTTLTLSVIAQAQKAGGEAVELLTAEPCPTGKRTLVLMPDQMMLQIHESVGHALEIDRILGDERNYAGGSFITPDDIGNFRYGSPLMNVAFDPTIAQELASYGADDIGNAAVKEYLIKDGILIRALGSLESQKRSGLRGVGGANWVWVGRVHW